MGDPLPINDATDLGHAIREAQHKRRLTQRELSCASGVGLRFLIELERGKPSVQFGKELCVLRALGIGLSAVDEAHVPCGGEPKP